MEAAVPLQMLKLLSLVGRKNIIIGIQNKRAWEMETW